MFIDPKFLSNNDLYVHRCYLTINKSLKRHGFINKDWNLRFIRKSNFILNQYWQLLLNVKQVTPLVIQAIVDRFGW